MAHTSNRAECAQRGESDDQAVPQHPPAGTASGTEPPARHVGRANHSRVITFGCEPSAWIRLTPTSWPSLTGCWPCGWLRTGPIPATTTSPRKARRLATAPGEPLVTQAETLVALDGLGLGAVALLGLLRWQRRPSAPSETVELRFARGLTADGVVAVLTGLAGLSARTSSSSTLSPIGTASGTTRTVRRVGFGHCAACFVGRRPTFNSSPMKTPPGLSRPSEPGGASWGRLGHVLLDSAAPDQTAGLLLGVLGEPLTRDERLLLRLALTPAGSRRLPREPSSRQTAQTADSLAWLGGGRSRLSSAERRGLEQKYGGRLLTTRITVGVTAETDARGRELVGRVLAVLRGRQGAVGRLRVRWLSRNRLRRALVASRRGAGVALSPAELAGLLAWPINGPQIDGLRLDLAPRLSPRRSVPRTGRVFAYSDRDRSAPTTGPADRRRACSTRSSSAAPAAASRR